MLQEERILHLRTLLAKFKRLGMPVVNSLSGS